jgi:hypothetical protein
MSPTTDEYWRTQGGFGELTSFQYDTEAPVIVELRNLVNFRLRVRRAIAISGRLCFIQTIALVI